MKNEHIKIDDETIGKNWTDYALVKQIPRGWKITTNQGDIGLTEGEHQAIEDLLIKLLEDRNFIE